MKRNRSGAVLIVIGVLLIAAAAGLVAYNLSEDKSASDSAARALAELRTLIPASPDSPVRYDPADTSIDTRPRDEVIPDYILNPEMDMPTQTVDELSYVGVIEFPTLGLSLPVIDEWSYPALSKAPCRYSGSPYTDDLIIAGHNYRSHFGRLDRLKEGSRVYFTDLDGNRFEYKVVLTESISGVDVDGMLDGGWDLSLFTCTMSGTYRTTVRLDRIDHT